jgi:hypothetical protein
MKRHFVTFLSPGTLFSEETTRPIDAWDIKLAVEMSYDVRARYNARPYGFYFTTRARPDDELDSKTIACSNTYYLGGKIETLDDVVARNDPNECILRSNMRINKWNKIIINDNSWRFTAPLQDGDIVLNYEPRKDQ